jgi:hypothetical protein
MEDFNRQYIKEHFSKLTPEEQREALARLTPEEQREALARLSPEVRLAGLSPEALLAALSEEQVRQLVDRVSGHRAAQPRKPRRKK